MNPALHGREQAEDYREIVDWHFVSESKPSANDCILRLEYADGRDTGFRNLIGVQGSPSLESAG